jgi:hypothetical protein
MTQRVRTTDPVYQIILNYDPRQDLYRATCFEEVKGDPSHD